MKAKTVWKWMQRCSACGALADQGAPPSCACAKPMGVIRLPLDENGQPRGVSPVASTLPPPDSKENP